MISSLNLSREHTKGKHSLSTPTASTRGSTRSSSRPFALDDDYTEMTDGSRLSTSSRGFRDGGPKEARLKRVAFLSNAKEVDHLFPVKVENIGSNLTEDSLKETFQEFGEVGDVYIPKDSRNRPLSNFAIVRYTNSEAQERALSQSPTSTLSNQTGKNRSLSVSPVRSQKTFFSKGTGYHGICNLPIDDGTYDRRSLVVEQDISLESCRSRSGYPWGSVRELKYLAPHPPPDALFSYSLRLDDLPRSVTEHEIKETFQRFGRIVDVSCPKPLVVTQQTKDPNCGFAFVRFADQRDRTAAFHAVKDGKVQFSGQSIKAKELLPSFWPSEKTRRYY